MARHVPRVRDPLVRHPVTETNGHERRFDPGAALGFGGIAGASAGIAKILFFIFWILFVVGLVMHAGRGRVP